MSLYSLPSHYGRPVEIDVCHQCNAIWFDQGESTQLSPDGTVALFQLVNERGGTSATAASKFGEGLRCVSCGTGMRLTNDRVKNTRFVYQSCPSGHGRLTTFYNFLAEKQFVRELTQLERAKLASSVQQIKCSSCAAPVDIGKTDACGYCRAPVSVFDRDAAKKAIEHYLEARHRQLPSQAPAGGSSHSYSGSGSGVGGFDYGGVDLAADILFALGRAATRGIGSAGSRAIPAAAATGVGAGAGIALADTGVATSGGLLESIGSGGAANAFPTATDALFASGLGDSANAVNALPDTMDATDALFGTTANAAGAAGGSGVFSEISQLFSSSTASNAADTLVDAGSVALEDAGASVLDSVGELTASGGDLVDLVSDGVGSLLGSLFD